MSWPEIVLLAWGAMLIIWLGAAVGKDKAEREAEARRLGANRPKQRTSHFGIGDRIRVVRGPGDTVEGVVERILLDWPVWEVSLREVYDVCIDGRWIRWSSARNGEWTRVLS